MSAENYLMAGPENLLANTSLSQRISLTLQVLTLLTLLWALLSLFVRQLVSQLVSQLISLSRLREALKNFFLIRYGQCPLTPPPYFQELWTR